MIIGFVIWSIVSVIFLCSLLKLTNPICNPTVLRFVDCQPKNIPIKSTYNIVKTRKIL